jgi:hypothetical protein
VGAAAWAASAAASSRATDPSWKSPQWFLTRGVADLLQLRNQFRADV